MDHDFCRLPKTSSEINFWRVLESMRLSLGGYETDSSLVLPLYPLYNITQKRLFDGVVLLGQ